MGLLAGAVFTALLLVAAIGDLRSRRIPNRLVAILALAWDRGLGHAEASFPRRSART